MDVSIIVPLYNEQDNVELCYQSVDRVMEQTDWQYEIVMVDDGSTDATSQHLVAIAERDRRVKVIEFRRNFGQTAAMRAGLDYATGDCIVTLDGDLQNEPADIPMLVEKVHEGYDLVHGWRKHRQDAFLSRRLPSKIANWLISRVTGFPVRDLGCTLKAMRREIALDLSLYGEMHRFIPILAHWQGARSVEVVTRHHPRQFGESKYGIWRTVRVLLDLVTVKYMIRHAVSPMRLFGGIGLSLIAVSGLSGLATVCMKLLGGIDMTGNPLLLLTVVAGLAAIQFFGLGLLGEVSARIYHECQDEKPYRIRSLRNVACVAEAITDGPFEIERFRISDQSSPSKSSRMA
ncbi:MAG: glycosyltransferase [Planctomycetaceae bacterium]|nr:glycosyltransferase [Planctomycetaceae bacterium]|tara:strand:+ start:302 stop:1339 length:1038 start_codon:yes stop_codon:yes gene_type:complete